jgi:hypothetical protein
MTNPRPKIVGNTQWQDILAELKDEPFKVRAEEIAFRTGAATDTVYRWMRGAIPWKPYQEKILALHRAYKERQEKKEQAKAEKEQAEQQAKDISPE